MRGRVLILLGWIALASGPAWAGGLYLNEFATPSMGTAGAGAFALAEDAACSFFNPAAMTRLDDPQLMVGAGLLYVDARFEPADDTPVPGGDGGNAGGAGPIAALYYVDPINDDWAWGFNVISVSAALLDFDDDWAGRFALDELTLLTVSFLPGVGYQINEEWAVGAGVGFIYGTLDQEVFLPLPSPTTPGKVKLEELDDTAVAFNLSAHWEPNEETTLGLAYGSGAEFELDGDITIDPIGAQTAINTDLELPQVIGLSGIRKIDDEWSVLASFRWEDWSSMGEQQIATENVGTVLDRNWEDTFHGSLGFRYQLEEDWMLQFGGAYDTSPVDDEDRTIDLAVDRQWRLACGAQYQYSERTKIGGAFTYANLGEAAVDQDTLKGEYDSNNILFFAMNVNWTS